MFKRYVATFTAAIFLIALLPITFAQKALAYQNTAYFNDLKIGLVSMSSTAIKATLNGSYTVNGQAYPSGSVMNFGISGTSLTLNGALQNQVTLIPNDKANLLTITTGTVSNKYMGSFLIKVYNGKILPINSIDMENYLEGVVGYEMSNEFPLEALKAQTVAARDYALTRLGWESVKGYDFDDTPGYQVYKGYNSTDKNVAAAVEQTKGQLLLYNDNLFETLYSAWHGGISEDSENVWGDNTPPLRSVIDPFENAAWPNGNRVFTNAQIQSTLQSKKYLASTDTFIKLDLNSITKFSSGRVSNINIIYKDVNGVIKTKSVTKDNTRTFLSLPSNLYTVTYDTVNAAYTFSGKGNGHGLGMSQIGARNRASSGQPYDQILKFYYQNTYLQNIILKASLSSFTQSTNSLLAGDSISFNASAAAGNGYGYLFKYVIKNGASTLFTRDYNENSTLAFIPAATGSYTIECYVKDKFSVSDYDDEKISSFTVYGASLLNNFTLNRTEALINQDISAAAEVQGGSGSYLYKYEVAQGGSVISTRDFSSDTQYVYNPSQAGSYTMTVYVKDSLSAKNYDSKQSQSFTVYDNLTIASITKDVENIFSGDTINFSTSVNGGSDKGSTYKYDINKDGFQVLSRDFDASPSLQYKPLTSGSYQVQVLIKDNLSTKDYDDTKTLQFTVYDYPKLQGLSSDKPQYLVGQNISINSASISGSGNYLYKYTITKDGEVLSSTDYSASRSLQYSTSSAGTYTISEHMKDVLSSKAYDDTAELNIPVYDQPSMIYTSSEKSILAGNTVSFSINEVNGSGKAQYRFAVMQGGNMIQDSGYTDSNTFNYTPAASGTYQVIGYMKDALSEKAYDAQDTITINVYNPQLTSVNVSGYFYEGKTVTFSALSAGVSPSGFSYRYEILNGGNIVVSNSFNNSGAFIFTPALPGVYTVKVYGKDGLSTNSYDSLKQFNITINSKPLYLSALPLKYGMLNSDVTALQNALIKLGYTITSVSGYFGTQTQNSVKSFQTSSGLKADGIVGNATYGVLNDALIQKSGIKNLTY